jgi:hypothetical protein
MQTFPIEKEEIENKIIDLINIGSGGRLIVFKPETDKKSDLAVKKRGVYEKKEIFLKIIFLHQPGEKPSADGFKDEIFLAKDFYFIFVFFDQIEQKINDSIWVIPFYEFKKTLDQKKDFTKFLIKKNDLGKLMLEYIQAIKVKERVFKNFKINRPG